jgi:lysophospholipase L1-like esterase
MPCPDGLSVLRQVPTWGHSSRRGLRTLWVWALAACSLLGTAPGWCHAAEEPDRWPLKDGDRIVFFGDSITQGGFYIDHIEAFLLCRFPEVSFQVFNRGISSETISGTSEPDHEPRRPWAHERFERDITSLKPSVLICCFGMNDGNYHPFEWPRFEAYQKGVRRLMSRAEDEAGVRELILMTPPPFDAYQRKNSDPTATSYGYKFPALDYDETLATYSEWLLSLADHELPLRSVIDLHGPLNEHMAARRERAVSFTIAPDAVHPNATGHWLMALQFLRQTDWITDGQRGHVLLQPLTAQGGNESISLPLFPPIDPDVEAASIELETNCLGDLDSDLLMWPSAQQLDPQARWTVLLDDTPIGEVTSAELGAGVAVPRQAGLAVVDRGQRLLMAVRERRQLEYWQFRAGTDKPLGAKPPVDDLPGRLTALTTEIEQLRQPVQVRISVRPAATP